MDLTRMAFCSGVTRPNTVYLLAMETTSFSLRPSSEMYLSAFNTPTRRATSETVTGLSPEMTFTATSFSLNQRIVCAASSRILSEMEMIASGLNPAGSLSPLICPEERATTSTRSPIAAYWLMILFSFSGTEESTNSGAPIATVPTPSNVTAESFRLEEKGIFLTAFSSVLCPK